MTDKENPESSSVRSSGNLPAYGEFPFPLSDSDTEAAFLTWVRNHSSYLAVGGFLNWAGAVAAYVRGVLGNLLVLMPVLIVLGSVLGWFHSDLLNAPSYSPNMPFSLGSSCCSYTLAEMSERDFPRS